MFKRFNKNSVYQYLIHAKRHSFYMVLFLAALLFFSCGENPGVSKRVKGEEMYTVQRKHHFFEEDNHIVIGSYYGGFNIVLIDTVPEIFFYSTHPFQFGCISSPDSRPCDVPFLRIKPDVISSSVHIQEIFWEAWKNMDKRKNTQIAVNRFLIQDVRYYELKRKLRILAGWVSTRIITEEEKYLITSQKTDSVDSYHQMVFLTEIKNRLRFCDE